MAIEFEGKPQPKLVQPGDPLVLGEDQVIEEDRDEEELEQKVVAIRERVHNATNVSPSEFRASRHRSIHDLPAEGSMMRAIAVVLVLTVFGLGDQEMASFLGISVGDVKRVREHQGYAELFNRLVDEIVNVNSTVLRGRIASYGNATLDELISLALGSKKENIRMTGVRDVLDRIGVGAKEEQGQSNTANELRIVIESARDSVKIEE
jgi:hypothetical protein